MDLGLTDKRVIVTGGSKGIGRAIAQAFLDEGARVAICAREINGPRAAAEQLSAHGEIHHAVADMGEVGAPADFVRWAADTMEGLDSIPAYAAAGDPA